MVEAFSDRSKPALALCLFVDLRRDDFRLRGDRLLDILAYLHTLRDMYV